MIHSQQCRNRMSGRFRAHCNFFLWNLLSCGSLARFPSAACAMASSTAFHFNPSPMLRGVFVGSGSDGMNEPAIAQVVVDLAGDSSKKSPKKVVYLGTATYDLPGPCQRQTEQFVLLGCQVDSLDVATAPLSAEGEALLDTAEIIIVSGGNTLYAMDRWKLLGIDQKLRQAMDRGAVLTGGSAGAICWFDGGHSDSADPDTWKAAMLVTSMEGDESSEAPKSAEESKSWEYIRIQGLRILPGLVCPHRK